LRHQPLAINPVGNHARTQADDDAGQAVRQAHGDHAGSAPNREGQPHEGQERERVAGPGDDGCAVHQPELAQLKQAHSSQTETATIR
jgi:hypothetical protein